MEAAGLMRKLLELERAIGIADAIQLRNLVMDAQAALLEMQRNTLTALHATSRDEKEPRAEPRIASWAAMASAARRPSAVTEDSEGRARLPLPPLDRMRA